jgi:NAD(P)-dependent dehydrogenase (short-subunit alcohol dehydrogenase family)
MSSQLGSLANPMEGWGHYGYNSSKAAINMLTRYLALDLKTAGITVISMHPGWVKTDMGGDEAPMQVYGIGIGESRPSDLTLENQDLVAKREDLGVA